jgi:hypothetical protein
MAFEIDAAIGSFAKELRLGLLHDEGTRRTRSLAVCVDSCGELDVETLCILAVDQARATAPICPLATHAKPCLLKAHLSMQHSVVAVRTFDEQCDFEAEGFLQPSQRKLGLRVEDGSYEHERPHFSAATTPLNNGHAARACAPASVLLSTNASARTLQAARFAVTGTFPDAVGMQLGSVWRQL